MDTSSVVVVVVVVVYIVGFMQFMGLLKGSKMDKSKFP